MSYEITTLGQEIRTARKVEGLSQEELAEKLGVERSTLSNWERNVVVPSTSKIRALLDAGIVTKSRARELIARSMDGYPVGKFVYEFQITAPRKLINSGAKFGLLYCKGGPEETLYERSSVNWEHSFKPLPGRGQTVLVTQVRQKNQGGFQFKFFVDFLPMGWEETAEALRSVGYIPDDHPGDGQIGRLWFLLPDTVIVTSPATGIKDNYFYPS